MWVYQTRAAIDRTLDGLAEHSSILQKPFVWYGHLFLRISHGVSRRQELTADELAARTVGARSLVEALKKIRGAAAVLGSYWSSEVDPVLRAGFKPPLGEGFSRFMGVPGVAAMASGAVEQALAQPEGDPYDTHPPLSERVQVLRALPDGPPSTDDSPAINLLVDVPQLEHDLLRAVGADIGLRVLPAIAWDEVGTRVYLPMWRRMAARCRGPLAGLTVDGLAENLLPLRQALVRADVAPKGNTREERARAVVWAVGAALAAALADAGWRIRANVGEPILLEGSVRHHRSLPRERRARGASDRRGRVETPVRRARGGGIAAVGGHGDLTSRPVTLRRVNQGCTSKRPQRDQVSCERRC